jgi:hypothetical protein
MPFRVTGTLKADYLALGSKLTEAISKSKGEPDCERLAKVNADEDPPRIEGSIAKFDARILQHLKETNGLREIK